MLNKLRRRADNSKELSAVSCRLENGDKRLQSPQTLQGMSVIRS